MKSAIVSTRKSSCQSMALFMTRSSSLSSLLLLLSPSNTLKIQRANVSTNWTAHNQINNLQFAKSKSESNQSLLLCYQSVRCYSANTNSKSNNYYYINSSSHSNSINTTGHYDNNNNNYKPSIKKKSNYKEKNDNKGNFRQSNSRNNLESIRKEFYVLMRELERRCTRVFTICHYEQHNIQEEELEMEWKKRDKNVNYNNKNEWSKMTESKEKKESYIDINTMSNCDVNDTNKDELNFTGNFINHDNYYYDDDNNDELRVQDQRLLEQLGVTELFSLYKNNDHKNESVSVKNEQEDHEPSTLSKVNEIGKTSNTNFMESVLENTCCTNVDNEEIKELRRFIEVMCDVLHQARLSPRVWLDKCVHRIIIKIHNQAEVINNNNTQEPSILAMETAEESSSAKYEKSENVNLNAKREAERMLSSLFTLKAATVLIKTSCERLLGKRYKMQLYMAHPNILYKEQSAIKKIKMERLNQNVNDNINIVEMKTVHNKLDEDHVFTTSEEELLNKLIKETNDMRYILHFFSSKLIAEFNVSNNKINLNESDHMNISSNDTDNDAIVNKSEAKINKSKLTELFNMCKANNTSDHWNENYMIIDETEFQSILLFVQAYVELATELNEIEKHTNTENGTDHLSLQIGKAIEAIINDLMTFLQKNEEVISDSYQDQKKISNNRHNDSNTHESRKANLVRCVRYVNEETIRSICCSAVKVFAFHTSGFENGYSLFVRFLQWKNLHSVNQNKLHQQCSSPCSASSTEYVELEKETDEVIENKNSANNFQDSLEESQKESINNNSTTKKEEENNREEHKDHLVNLLESETNKYKRDSSFQELTRVYYEDALYFIVALTHNFTSTILLCQSNSNNNSSTNNNTLVYNYDMIANLFIKLIKETEIGYKMPLCITLTRETFIQLLHSLSHVCTTNQFSSIGENVNNKNINNNSSSSLSLWGYDWLHNMYKTVLQNSSLEMHRQEVNSENEHDRILLASLLAMSSCASSSSSSSSTNNYNYFSVSDAMQVLFVNNCHNHSDSENDSTTESDQVNDDNNNSLIKEEENETNSKTTNKHYNQEKHQIIKLLNKGRNNKWQLWSNNTLLLFNKLQRPHSSLKMTEREVALQCVLLKLVNPTPCYRVILSNIFLRHTLSKFNIINNNDNSISITSTQSTKCIHVDNANALIQSATCEAETIFARYMSYLQQQNYIPINVRHGIVIQFLLFYCTLMDFTCIIQHYEMVNTNKTQRWKEPEEQKKEDIVHLINDFSDITAMMYVVLDQNTLNTSKQEQISVSRDLYAVRTFYLHLLVLYCQLQTRLAQQRQQQFKLIENDKINDSSKITEHSLFNSQDEADNALCNLQQWVETLCSVNKVQTVPLCVLQLLHSLHSLPAKYSYNNCNNKNKSSTTKFVDYVLLSCHKLKCEDENNQNYRIVESSIKELELYKDNYTSNCDSLTLCLHWCKVWNEQESKREWHALGELSAFSLHVQELLNKYDNITNEYKKRVESNVGEYDHDKHGIKNEATHDVDNGENENKNDAVFFRSNTMKRSNRFFVNVNK